MENPERALSHCACKTLETAENSSSCQRHPWQEVEGQLEELRLRLRPTEGTVATQIGGNWGRTQGRRSPAKLSVLLDYGYDSSGKQTLPFQQIRRIEKSNTDAPSALPPTTDRFFYLRPRVLNYC